MTKIESVCVRDYHFKDHNLSDFTSTTVKYKSGVTRTYYNSRIVVDKIPMSVGKFTASAEQVISQTREVQGDICVETTYF